MTEIPAGGPIKYGTEAKTGFIVADRFQLMPVACPANQRSQTQSPGGDNDPLDVIFYTRAPLQPDTLIKLRAIGVVKMIDGGEVDVKIVAVPASKIDPSYSDIKSISDLLKMEQERLQVFFRVYRQQPEGRKQIKLNGFRSAEAAKSESKRCLAPVKRSGRRRSPPCSQPSGDVQILVRLHGETPVARNAGVNAELRRVVLTADWL